MQADSQHYNRCIKILSQSPLFKEVEPSLLKEMLALLSYETRLKAELALTPQEEPNHFYIVISGRAKVSVYNPDNGREHILFLIGPGDCFDLIGVLDNDWNGAVAVALDDMEVLSTTVRQARTWVAQHPEFNKALLPYLGKQMHALADQATDISLYDTEVRLSRLILRNLVKGDQNNEIQLINDLSQETIASMIGSVRVVVARHLKKWKQNNIVSGKRGHWLIRDLQVLLEKAKH